MNYLQSPYVDLLLIYQSTIVYEEKLVSSAPIIFDDYIRVSPVAFFVPDFDLFSYEADNFTFTVLH